MSEVCDKKLSYSQFVEAIRSASAFDLYRLKCAIDVEMESPQKLQVIKSQLIVGQKTAYFDREKNRCVDCVIRKISRSKVYVYDLEQQIEYRMPYFMLNLDSDDATIEFKKEQKMTKNQLATGDLVGFVHKGIEHYGQVIKLNPKSASVMTTKNSCWKVSYGFLFRIYDTQVAAHFKSIS